MRYLALIYTTEMDPTTVAPADVAAMMAQYNQFGADATGAGVLLGGEALQPTSTATTIRIREGQRTTTDGPFIETKEALGGYYVLDCADLDEAIAWASKIPGARHGAVELRPILEFGD